MLINQTFKCGHTCQIDIRGKAAQREARQRQLNRRVCPECMQHEVKQYEAKYKIPALTDKYASCLRYECLKAWFSSLPPNAKGSAGHYLLIRQWEKAVKETNPKFWIEHQTFKDVLNAIR